MMSKTTTPSPPAGSARPETEKSQSPQVTVTINLGSSVSRRIRRIRAWEERSATALRPLTRCD
jgi:hypothetical protein